jgi:hypothetical protein
MPYLLVQRQHSKFALQPAVASKGIAHGMMALMELLWGVPALHGNAICLKGRGMDV